MSEINQLSLFGIDLSGLHRRAILGIQQLVWGDEAGLRAWLSPEPQYCSLADLEAAADAEMPPPGHSFQVLLPESQVLFTGMTLPSSAEIFMEEAVATHVDANSPFSEEETCWGSKIVDRSDGSLLIDIIIVARSTAETAALAARRVFASHDVVFGLSAESNNGRIPLIGYQDPGLQAPYLANLKQFAMSLAIGVAGIAFLTAIPVIWSMQTAQQYSDLLHETEKRSRDIVAVRGALVEAQERVFEAERFFSEHASYRPWLHKVAAVTPDSVYLNRLSNKEDMHTVSGLAVNAADYQAILVEAAPFSDVTAPSAFTLDNRAKRERFTLTMALSQEGAQ